MTSNKIILDLCGNTGAWSRPYANAKYDVRIITLPYFDVRTYRPPDNVHGILAAPPCNQFSLAKGNQPRDFVSGMEIIRACLNIIWICHPAFWCLENPRGFLRQFIGKPPHTIHYWWYGDDLDKPTDLWGYYNLPRQRYFQPPGLLRLIKDMPGVSDQERQLNRAKTPPAFAQAFFYANP